MLYFHDYLAEPASVAKELLELHQIEELEKLSRRSLQALYPLWLVNRKSAKEKWGFARKKDSFRTSLHAWVLKSNTINYMIVQIFAYCGLELLQFLSETTKTALMDHCRVNQIDLGASPTQDPERIRGQTSWKRIIELWLIRTVQ